MIACGPAAPAEAEWPPTARKWYERAEGSYRAGDIEDAEFAVENALNALPQEPKVRVLAAQVSLSQLDYDRTIELLSGIQTPEALGIRGRAHWYAGRIHKAADELERLLADPDVRDPWAVDVAKLARRGRGRKPFEMSGGLLAVTEMPRIGGTSLIVPVEVNGEPALALIATGVGEAVLDSSGGGEASWVSLRFGERVEVSDVPALAQDLSGLSRQLNAPIKMLIGVNLLRHLRPTFDFAGGQFVVRTFDPPPPPQATTLHLSYIRGGGMLMRGAFGLEQGAQMGSFLIKTESTPPLALDAGGWKKAGVALSALEPSPNFGSVKQGVLPLLRLGAFEVPRIPGLLMPEVAKVEKGLDIELDGLVGSGLLAAFRVTLADHGRTMWLEDLPAEAYAQHGGVPLRSTLSGEAAESGEVPPAEGTDEGAAPEPGPDATPPPTAPGAAP